MRTFKDNRMIVVVAAVLVFAYLWSKKVETFTGGKMLVTEDEYKQEVQVLASYVGPYIGDIYSYLRTKYSSPDKGTFLQPLYQPGGLDDPTLADPALSVYRGHIKSFLGSAKLRMVQKYGQPFLAKYKPKYDLDYEQSADRVMKITYTMDGETQTFYI